MLSFRAKSFLILAVTVFWAAAAAAQTATARIEGNIADHSGAMLPGQRARTA